MSNSIRNMFHKTPSGRLPAVVAVIAALAAAAAVSASASKQGETASHISFPSVSKPATSLFGVLRNSDASAVAAASHELSAATDGMSTESGMFAPTIGEAAQLSVPSPEPGRPAWIMPAKGSVGGLCLYVPDSTETGAVSCEPEDGAVAGYLFDASYPTLKSDDPLVIGVAPDGVESVTAIAADGAETSVPVVDNGYEIHMTHLRHVLVGEANIDIPGPPPAG